MRKRASTADVTKRTQALSAMISLYLRKMGADPELFELMSTTLPEQLFIPSKEKLTELGSLTSAMFENFQLMPKKGEVVAIAKNPRNQDGIELLYEVETFCWKGKPMINLYAETAGRGLRSEHANPAKTHIDGWTLRTGAGTRVFGPKLFISTPSKDFLRRWCSTGSLRPIWLFPGDTFASIAIQPPVYL